MIYHLGGVLWWLLRRLHPCGIDIDPAWLDFDAVIEAEGWPS